MPTHAVPTDAHVPPARRPRVAVIPAVLWAAGAGAWFFAVYNLTNWLTSLRPGVPTVAFGFERLIPFLPWTVVPYWSLDVLFVAAFLACRDRPHLRRHGRRVALAVGLAGACFLIVPLTTAGPRPTVEGDGFPSNVYAALFAALDGFDRPYNLCPSLHVALRSLLWGVLVPFFAARWMRWSMAAWLVLVGVSTLTTYQHHLIDVAGGQVLAALCLALVPEPRLPDPFPAPPRSHKLPSRPSQLGAGPPGVETL